MIALERTGKARFTALKNLAAGFDSECRSLDDHDRTAAPGQFVKQLIDDAIDRTVRVTAEDGPILVEAILKVRDQEWKADKCVTASRE